MSKKVSLHWLRGMLCNGELHQNTRNPDRAMMDKKYIDDYMGHHTIDSGTLELWASAEKRKGIIGERYVAHVWYNTSDKKVTFHYDVESPKDVYTLLKRMYEERQLDLAVKKCAGRL